MLEIIIFVSLHIGAIVLLVKSAFNYCERTVQKASNRKNTNALPPTEILDYVRTGVQ